MLAKTAKVSLAAVPLFLIALVGVSSVYAEKLRVTTIRAVPYYELPLMAMEENRLWAKQGLEVEFIPVGSARAMDAGLLAGEFQMAVTFASGNFIRLSRGATTTIVADLGAYVSWYLWVRGDGKVTQPGDLKGARIATLRLGSTSHAYVKTMVEGSGLKGVKIVALGGIRESLAALRAGAVDAILMTRFVMARLESEGLARRIASLSDFLPTREWDPTTLVVVKPLVNKDPARVKRAVASMLQGTSFVANNYQWSIRKIAEAYGYSPRIAETIYGLIVYSKDGKVYPDRLGKLRDFLVEHGLLGEKVPALEEAYTSEFVGADK